MSFLITNDYFIITNGYSKAVYYGQSGRIKVINPWE